MHFEYDLWVVGRTGRAGYPPALPFASCQRLQSLRAGHALLTASHVDGSPA